MFRKENGVTLVALVITIIVLLILAGVTISMVLGDEGILKQASDARAAQNKATVSDQAAVAYATVRAEQIARGAGVSNKPLITDLASFTSAVASEMDKSKAFVSKVTTDEANGYIYVQLNGTKGLETYCVTLTKTGDMIVLNSNNGISLTSTTPSGLTSAPATY